MKHFENCNYTEVHFDFYSEMRLNVYMENFRKNLATKNQTSTKDKKVVYKDSMNVYLCYKLTYRFIDNVNTIHSFIDNNITFKG